MLASLFTKLSNRYRQETIFYLLTTAFLLLYALFAFVLYPYRDQWQPIESAAYLEQLLPGGFKGFISMYQNWTLTCFYVACELWTTMIVSVLFWRFANDITKPAEGRRFYGVLSIGFNLAIIVAGFVTASLTSGTFNPTFAFGNTAWEQTMMLLILIVIGSGLLAMATFRWMHTNVERTAPTPPKEPLSLIKSFLHVSQSKYLLCMAVIVVAYGLVINLVEVVWKDQIKSLYPAALDYNHYMGNLQMLQGMCALLFAIGLSEGVKRLGWTNITLIAPVLLLICTLLFFVILFFQERVSSLTLLGISPLVLVVFFGSAQNCIGKACKYSIVDVTKEMAFIPLSPESKIKGKTAIDGIGSRLGKSGGAIIHQGLLLLFTTVSASSLYVGMIALIALVVWIIAICHLGKKIK